MYNKCTYIEVPLVKVMHGIDILALYIYIQIYICKSINQRSKVRKCLYQVDEDIKYDTFVSFYNMQVDCIGSTLTYKDIPISCKVYHTSSCTYSYIRRRIVSFNGLEENFFMYANPNSYAASSINNVDVNILTLFGAYV